MSNAALSWINRIADPATSLSASSEVVSLPVANLADDHLAVKWRGNGVTAAYVDADFGSALPVGVVGVFGSNFTGTATWRILLSAVAAGAGELLDTGVMAMNVAAGYGQAVHMLAAEISARYLRLEFDDPGLASLGYFEIGAAWAGPVWQPARNYAYEASAGWVDPSARTKSRGGQVYVDRRAAYRVAELQFRGLTRAELFNSAFEIDRVGIASNVLLVPDPDGSYLNREAILGTVAEVTPATRTAHDVFAKTWRIEERR
jgi:hypothetical protein